MSRGRGFLPQPFYDFIPDGFKTFLNQAGINLCAKIDTHITEWLVDIINIGNLNNPLKCSAKFLIEFDYLLNAGIRTYDSDITKRKKILSAISTHKKRGSWQFDAKVKIDSITGYNAKIYLEIIGDQWIICGDSVLPNEYYWSAVGGDGIDTDLGISIYGDGLEAGVAGIVYINCHLGVYTGVLSAEQIAQVVEQLDYDIVPAYMKVQLGYLNSLNQFIKYTGGLIG